MALINLARACQRRVSTHWRVVALLSASATLGGFAYATWRQRSEAVRLYYEPSPKLQKHVEACPSLHEDSRSRYSPSLFLLLDFWGTVHTFGHFLLRNLTKPKPSYTRQLVHLSDGGTVALDWWNQGTVVKSVSPSVSPPPPTTSSAPSPTSLPPSAPVIVLCHGLCGHSGSSYVLHMASQASARGYRVVAFVARGCGGVELTTPETFTAARTSDLKEALLLIHATYPDAAGVYGVGFSLGAAIIAKLVGEEAAEGTELLKGVVCVSIPWDFNHTTPVFAWWSKWKLANDLKRYVTRGNNEHMLRQHPNVDMEAVLQSKTVREFDTHAVVPVHGYKDVHEYYRDASPIAFSHDIHVPTLTLSADDDGICAALACPGEPDQGRRPQNCHNDDGSEGGRNPAQDMSKPPPFGPGLVVARTTSGGHVAFAEGFGGVSWADRVALEWIEACRTLGA